MTRTPPATPPPPAAGKPPATARGSGVGGWVSHHQAEAAGIGGAVLILGYLYMRSQSSGSGTGGTGATTLPVTYRTGGSAGYQGQINSLWAAMDRIHQQQHRRRHPHRPRHRKHGGGGQGPPPRKGHP